MTATIVEPTVETSTPVIILPEPQSLYRAVSNALLFTVGAREYLPALRAVRFERDLDGTLTVVATDRKRLFTETVENTMEGWKGQLTFLLTYDDAKRLANVLKDAGKFGQVSLTVEDTRLKVQAGGIEITVAFEQAEFPAWRKVMPSEDMARDIGGVALDPGFLGHLGKLKLPAGAGPAQLKFFGPGKPVQIAFTEGPLIWQMPVTIR